MIQEQLLTALCKLLQEVSSEERLAAFRGFKHGRSPQECSYLDAGFDLFLLGLTSGAQMQRPAVVALIHGIRTAATWQEKVRGRLDQSGGVIVVPIGYGYLDVIRFLGFGRRAPIDRVTSELRDLQRLYPGCELVVMAHSFGTYIVSKILREAVDIRISRLLLCGSIIPASYRWDRLSHEFMPDTLVNEVGTKDFWPVLAKAVSFGYGVSGSFGFKSARVFDRYFAYGHSDFFTDEHIDRYWKPFVYQGTVVRSPFDVDRPTPPFWLGLVSVFPLVKLIMLAIIALTIMLLIR